MATLKRESFVQKRNRDNMSTIEQIEQKVPLVGNTIINKNLDFTEVIFYKDDFNYFLGRNVFVDMDTGEVLKDDIDRSRKLIQKGDILRPLADTVTIENIQRTIGNSCKRAKDNYYGYAYNNRWNYFLTLTFDPKRYDTSDDNLKLLWKKFREKIQYIKPSIKILCVPERHKSGVLHFHCLIGNINLDKDLIPAINRKTGKQIKSRTYNSLMYNIRLWHYGFSMVAQIDKDKTSQQVVANYLIKYVGKETSIGYNQKKYYRTNNLDFKNKEVNHFTQDEKQELINSLFVVNVKKTDDRVQGAENERHK